jgi:hypothetical protein
MHHFRSFNRYLLISLSLLGLSVSYAHAAPVSGLQNVLIDGTRYDVRFHGCGSWSFCAHDGSGNYPDGFVQSEADPEFWGNGAGAEAAAIAIMTTLGGDDYIYTWPCLANPEDGYWSMCPRDDFMVPYSVNGAFSEWAVGYRDEDWLVGVDEASRGAYHVGDPSRQMYASFTTSTVPVPVPATVWLFGAALIGLVGFSKRKSGIAA